MMEKVHVRVYLHQGGQIFQNSCMTCLSVLTWVKLKKTVISSFYFPHMSTHIEPYVSSFEHCQRDKNYTANTRSISSPMTTSLRRFVVFVFALDILTFDKQCKNGFDSVVVFTDRLSNRSYIAPCYRTSTGADLARIFFDTVFRNQGIPRVLLSDNGLQFYSFFLQEFFALLRTDVKLTSTYHPQSYLVYFEILST